MQWSRASIKPQQTTVVKKDAEKSSQSDVSVLTYVPDQFNFGTPKAALDYLRLKDKGSGFVLSDVLRETTGVDEIERMSEEQKIENKVLEKLGSIQEEAYQKAYQLGLEEGLKKAYEEKKGDIEHNLTELETMMAHLSLIKEEMFRQNETHLIKLVYKIASRIAFDHIEEKPEIVVSVIKDAVESAQADEEVTVLVSEAQVDFLEKMKAQTGREFEFLKKIKFQVSNQVSSGGCIIETNYGVVDARIDERVHKLWTEMKQAFPRVKSPIT